MDIKMSCDNMICMNEMKPNLNELWNFCSLVDFSETTTEKESQTHTCIPTCFWVPQPFSTPSQVSGC